MVKSEITLFLKNVPGEIGRLTRLFASLKINIEAITIHDASTYIEKMLDSKKESIKKESIKKVTTEKGTTEQITSNANYDVMRTSSKQFVLVRMIVDNVDKARIVLSKEHYLFDVIPVIAIEMKNTPGAMAKISSQFGKEGININYVYGSITPKKDTCRFIFCS